MDTGNGNANKKPGKIGSFVDCKQLIEAVKHRPSLYNSKMRSTIHKNELWKEVAAIVGRNEMECRIAWGSLRSSYARHLQNRRKCQSGELQRPFRAWYLADEFDFLEEHMKLSPTATQHRLYFKPAPKSTPNTTTVFNMIPYKTEKVWNCERSSSRSSSKNNEDEIIEDYIEILDDSLDDYDFQNNETDGTSENSLPASRFLADGNTNSSFPPQQNQIQPEYSSFQVPEHFPAPQSNSTFKNPNSNGYPSYPVTRMDPNSVPRLHPHPNEYPSFPVPNQMPTSNSESSLLAEESQITDPRERSTMNFFKSILFDIGRLSDRQLRMFKQDILRDLNKYLDDEQID